MDYPLLWLLSNRAEKKNLKMVQDTKLTTIGFIWWVTAIRASITHSRLKHTLTTGVTCELAIRAVTWWSSSWWVLCNWEKIAVLIFAQLKMLQIWGETESVTEEDEATAGYSEEYRKFLTTSIFITSVLTMGSAITSIGIRNAFPSSTPEFSRSAICTIKHSDHERWIKYSFKTLQISLPIKKKKKKAIEKENENLFSNMWLSVIISNFKFKSLKYMWTYKVSSTTDQK